MLNRARTLSFGGRGGWGSPRPQPSGKTDEMAAMIQILHQFHSIDALKASPAGRTDIPPGPGGDGRKTAPARLLRATYLVFALCALMAPAPPAEPADAESSVSRQQVWAGTAYESEAIGENLRGPRTYLPTVH
jgi:hypothetical protein